ncbi:MAG: 3-deoxy-7-phosphoheptulonate synthase [Opitutaceae bacterium]
MHPQTSDLRICATKPLLAPAILEEELPLDSTGAALVARSRREVAKVIAGKDDRLVVVVGPCSIHDPAAALDYAGKLLRVRERYADTLMIVMRVYFEKPRTVIGWRGLIADPGLDGSYRINTGLRLARRLLLDITARGLPVGTEFLDTTLGQYYADLVTWGAIGARTVESQVHRELASGLSMPVGFKNRTDGDVQVAVDALKAARHPHWFPSLTREGAPAVLVTTGNDQTHLILRGGSQCPNYSAEHIRSSVTLLKKAHLPRYVMVDCSHGNSGKDAERQPAVAADVAKQIAAGQRAICGVMIESNLAGGSQSPGAKPLVYGRSITDGCLSWEKTLPLLSMLSDAVEKRRRK